MNFTTKPMHIKKALRYEILVEQRSNINKNKVTVDTVLNTVNTLIDEVEKLIDLVNEKNTGAIEKNCQFLT